MNSETLDMARLEAFLDRFVADAGASMHAATVILGDRLGLYAALAKESASAEQLASRTGTNPRMVLEWARAQAAAGYIEYDPATKRYSMTPEQSFALAAQDGLSVPGAFLVAQSVMHDIDRLEDAFRSDRGMGWHEHHESLFHGTERFFRPSYAMHLVSSWIPALDGMTEKLERGAKVADVGCGHGASTIVMAQAYPRSTFVGFDYHPPSIERARALAREAGVADRVRFEVAKAKEFPGNDWDMVAFFDCLHDMGDPAGAASHVRQSLKPDGSWMVVEPLAADRDEDNMHPIGRVYYSASALICTPASLSQEVGAALGAQAGEARLAEVIRAGGFSKVQRVAETPFNMVLEAKP